MEWSFSGLWYHEISKNILRRRRFKFIFLYPWSRRMARLLLLLRLPIPLDFCDIILFWIFLSCVTWSFPYLFCTTSHFLKWLTGVNIVLFADICIRDRKAWMPRFQQIPARPHIRGVVVWPWNLKVNEGKTRAISPSEGIGNRVSDEEIQLNGPRMALVHDVKYVYRLLQGGKTRIVYIDRLVARTLGTSSTIYFFFEDYSIIENNISTLNIQIKLSDLCLSHTLLL
jgi:hypothetical protein